MAIDCTEGWSSKFPPFLGDVKIENFRVRPHTASPTEKARATGRAMVKKWTPFNSWGPLEGRDVIVTVEGEEYVSGKTDSDGRFDIEFEVPKPVAAVSDAYRISVELPEPSGGISEHHLKCGPVGLVVVPDESFAKCRVIE